MNTPQQQAQLDAETDIWPDVPWLVEEVERLEAWKAEALEVMASLPELGKALGLPLGVQVTGPATLDEVARLTGIEAHRDNLAAMIRRLSEFLDSRSLDSWKHGACWAAEYAIKSLTARAESAEAEVGTLRAKVAAVEALHWDAEGKCAHCRDCYHDDYLPWPCPTAAALATSPTPSETGEGQHVAREVFTADGIPFVRCSCSTALSPQSAKWLGEHVPNGGVAELQAVVKRQADQA